MEQQGWMRELLEAEGAYVDCGWHCPHDRNVCACRKPGAELLRRAAEDLGYESRDATMTGDAESDVLAGQAVGEQTIRLGVDVETSADLTVASLEGAVNCLLADR